MGNERLALGVLISGVDLYSKGYFGTLQCGLYRGSGLTSGVAFIEGVALHQGWLFKRGAIKRGGTIHSLRKVIL